MNLVPWAPGYIVAFSYGLSAVMLSLVNPPRGNVWQRLAVWVFFPAVQLLFSYVTDFGDDRLYFLLLFCVFSLTVMNLYLSCDIPIRNAVHFACYAFLMGEFITSLFWQVHLFILERWSFIGWAPFAGYFGTALIVLVCFYLYERHFREQNEQLQVSNKQMMSTLLTTGCIFLFSNVSNISRDTPFSGQTSLQINLIRLLVDGAGLLLLETIHMMRYEAERRMEVTMLRKLMEQQYDNYQASEQSMALIHRKYHDLKHQIAFLRDEVSSEEKTKYLDRMESEIQAFEAKANTGSQIVDTVLTAKSLQCQSLHILLNVMADGRLLDFMDPVDLSALLGNLLDNAIEHVQQIDEPDKRWIQFQLRQNKNFIVLAVGNHFQGEIRFRGGLPVTSKQDERYHGYGTRSIRDTAAAYGGTVNFTAEDGWFEARILFMQQD